MGGDVLSQQHPEALSVHALFEGAVSGRNHGLVGSPSPVVDADARKGNAQTQEHSDRSTEVGGNSGTDDSECNFDAVFGAPVGETGSCKVYLLQDDRGVAGETVVPHRYVLDSGGGIHLHPSGTENPGEAINVIDVSGGSTASYKRKPPSLFDTHGDRFLFGNETNNCSSTQISESICSLRHLLDAGYKVTETFENLISPKGNLIPIIRNTDGLFEIHLFGNSPKKAYFEKERKYRVLMNIAPRLLDSRRRREKTDIELLKRHERLGHQTQLPERLKCQVCMRAKGRRKPLKRGGYQQRRRAHVVHVDLFGPLPAQYGPFVYCMVFQQPEGWCEVEFLTSKADAYKHLSAYKIRHQKVSLIVSDNGGEFTSAKFQAAASECGMDHEFCSPYHPELNGLAENAVKRTCTNARTLMLGAPHVKTKHWYLAAKYANRISNRLPKQSLEGSCGYKNRYGEEPELRGNYRRWGERILFRLRKEQRGSKLEEVFQPGYFVGLQEGMREGVEDFLILTENGGKIVRSCEVKFPGDVLTHMPKPEEQPPAEGVNSHSQGEFVFAVKGMNPARRGSTPRQEVVFIQLLIRALTFILATFSAVLFASKKTPYSYNSKPNAYKLFINRPTAVRPLNRTAGRAPARNRNERRAEWRHFKKHLRSDPHWRQNSMQYTKNYIMKQKCVPDDYLNGGPSVATEELVDFLNKDTPGLSVDDYFVYATKVKITPSLFEEAGWVDALKKEYTSFKNKNAYEPMSVLPDGVQAIPMVLLAEVKEGLRKKIRVIV